MSAVNKIKIFWEWFSKNCQNFGKDFENVELLNELDERIEKLGNFNWEVGPGLVKENFLVISPNGDFELLKDTKEIISYSKECIGWEYYYAKPPKQWKLIFDFETNEGKAIEINASQWEYVLLRCPDGMFEIIIKASQMDKFDDTDKLVVGEILLDGILGEELRMESICEIELVGEFENSNKNKANHIMDLSNHLKQLLAVI